MRLILLAACALAAACGDSQPNPCAGVLCSQPVAFVYLVVVESDGGPIVVQSDAGPIPQTPDFSYQLSTEVPPMKVSTRTFEDGGTEACDCWRVGVRPGVSTVSATAPGHDGGSVVIDAGSVPTQCCGVQPAVRSLRDRLVIY